MKALNYLKSLTPNLSFRRSFCEILEKHMLLIMLYIFNNNNKKNKKYYIKILDTNSHKNSLKCYRKVLKIILLQKKK